MKAHLSRLYSVPILLPCPQTQRTYVGQWIRRTIGKGALNTGPDALPVRTFRVRHGNGFYGSILNEPIQDQYDYFVPWPNAENCPDSTREKFAAAVTAWQALSDTEKKWWNDEVWRLHLNMPGYNLYIRKYILDEL